MFFDETFALMMMGLVAWIGLVESQWEVSAMARKVALVAACEFLGLTILFDASAVYGSLFVFVVLLSAVALVARSFNPFREQAKALAEKVANHAAALKTNDDSWKAELLSLQTSIERNFQKEVRAIKLGHENEVVRLERRHKKDLEERDQALANARCEGYLDMLDRIGELEDDLKSERSAHQATALSKEAGAHAPVKLAAGHDNVRVSALESELVKARNDLVLERAKAASETHALSSQISALSAQLETARHGDEASRSSLQADCDNYRQERDEARRMLVGYKTLAEQSSSAAAAAASLKQRLDATSSELNTLRSFGAQLQSAHDNLTVLYHQAVADCGQADAAREQAVAEKEAADEVITNQKQAVKSLGWDNEHKAKQLQNLEAKLKACENEKADLDASNTAELNALRARVESVIAETGLGDEDAEGDEDEEYMAGSQDGSGSELSELSEHSSEAT